MLTFRWFNIENDPLPRARMPPPTGPNANPLIGKSKLVFAPDSRWLIGLDFTVLEFVRVAIVFNAPKFYGLVIALTGMRAKQLNGLSFELLYKKMTDDIGVFRVRLQVPDAFRQIDFGVVSVTLGIITVDIFTNSNFKNARRDGNPWNPNVFLFSDSQPVKVNLTLLPVLPIADVPVAWGETPPTPPATPGYQVAFMLATAVPGTQDSNDTDISFNKLVEIVLRWSVTAVGLAPFGSTVTPAALDLLSELLNEPETAHSAFSYENLGLLFDKNLRLQIDGRPTAAGPSSGVAFPIVPALGWHDATLPGPDERTRHFDSYMPVDRTYERELYDYLNRLLPGSHPPVAAGAGGVESMATFVFRDYFMLIAKSAVDEAKQLMTSLPYTKNLGRSLNEIVRDFKTLNTIHVDDLLHHIFDGDAATRISNQVSRFMLYGLRIPKPQADSQGVYHATGPLTGLYVLTGQQVLGVGPAPGTADDASPLAVSFMVPGDQKQWVHLGTETVVGSSGSLIVSISNHDLRKYAPDTVLVPEFEQPLHASKLWFDQPMRWDLQQHLLWRTPTPFVLPGAVPADVNPVMPGIWPLPASLLQRARQSDTTTYALGTIDPNQGPSVSARDVQRWAWGCVIDFNVRRVPGAPGLNEVFGADTALRQILLRAWEHIAGSGDDASVTLLYRPATTAGMPPGLASPILSAQDGAYLIKANLSTETHSGMLAERRRHLAAGDAPAVCAPITDAANFLMLLWQCSVVGTGGYWLQASGTDGKPALPDSVYGSDGLATLSVLITVNSQTRPAPLRALLSFNNCAVVGDMIDPGAVHLVVEAHDDPNAKLRLPNVQPGNVGFELLIKRPAKPDVTDPLADRVNRTRRCYQLVGYDLLPTEAFAGNAPGVPVGPQKPAPPLASAAAGRELWSMMQVIPAARFALSHPLPDLTGLPSPALDPYAGIQLVGGAGSSKLGALRVQVWFQDRLGNATEGAPADPSTPTTGGSMPPPPGQLDVPVGYMDAVIGITSWPALTATFRVPEPRDGGTPSLLVELGFPPGAYLPAPTESADVAAKAASDHRERYARIYYQVMQDEVEANLLTTLKTDMSGQPIRLVGQIGGLRGYAAAAYAFLATSAELQRAFAASSCRTLNDVVARYGVWFDGLAEANAEVKLSAIFADQSHGTPDRPQIGIPRFALFKQGDTAEALSATPAQLLLDDRNKMLPLRAGVELSVPPRFVRTPEQQTTITALATREKCAVAALVLANVDTKNLLTVGFSFELGDATVKVGDAETTLNDVARTFRTDAGIPVDATTLGTASANIAGVFDAGKTFRVASYTAIQDETLDGNGSGADAASLANANTLTADLFAAGTPIYLETVDGTSVFQDVLSAAARTFGITAGQLLAFNATALLATGAALLLPGRTLLPQPLTTVRIPYRIAAGDTLDLIAERFLPLDSVTPVHALATANASLPGVVAGGQIVEVNGRTVTTIAGDSFQSVAERFDPPVSLDSVIDFLRVRQSYLSPGGVLLCPPALATHAATPSLAAVAALFGVDPVQLALANASVTGLLRPNKTFSLMRGAKMYTVVTPADPDHPVGTSPFTLNSIVAGFAMQRVETNLAEVVRANATLPALVSDAPLLLPPPVVVLQAALAADPVLFPGAIFPIRTWMEIRRSNRNLILPDFQGTDDQPSPAEACISPVAPSVSDDGEDARGEFKSALTLKDFARNLELAFGMLRVCTGKVSSDEGGSADVWAVGFGPGLIEKVAVAPPASTAPAPQFFALRPLFNHLVSRQQVMVAPLKDDGTLETAVPRNFQSIDVEAWASDFLADVDLFLSATYAAPAYRGATRDGLESVIRAKADLAGAIANGLDYVLDLGQPSPATRPADWQSAHDFLRQYLLTGLSRAWETDVMLQYDAEATVSPRWAASLHARLSGTAVKGEGVNEGDDVKRVSIAGAKIDLAQSSSYVTFGVTLQKSVDAKNQTPSGEAEQSYLDLDMAYGINEVEFNVKPVAQGYEASDRVSFVLPPDTPTKPPGWTLDLGAAKAPLPLRNYPSPAVLLAHDAQPTYPDTTDWNQSPFWNYTFTYQHTSAAQDQVRFDVVFNEPDADLRNAMGDTDDLFAALAQYRAVRGQLWDILKSLTATTDAVAPETPLANAVATWASLTQRVRDTWALHWGSPPHAEWVRMALPSAVSSAGDAGLPQFETYRYLSTSEWAKDAQGNSYYVALTLERDAASTGAVGWPEISVSLSDGQTLQLQRGEPVGRQCRYSFPAGSSVPVGSQLNVEVALRGLHLAHYQKATAVVAIIHNTRLLGIAGPRTRDGFIFMTPPATFAAPVVPLLVWDSFEIGDWIPDGSRLAAVMSGLLGGDVSGNRPASFLLQYGYELMPSVNMQTRLPISMRPTAGYTASDAATMAQTLSQWQNDNQPSVANAEWVFSITIYSVAERAESRPLLEIRELLSPLAPA